MLWKYCLECEAYTKGLAEIGNLLLVDCIYELQDSTINHFKNIPPELKLVAYSGLN